MGRRARNRRHLIDSKHLAVAAAVLAEQKKGEAIRVYRVAEHLKVADYFVLISGMSRPHVKAIKDEVHIALKSLGETHTRAEGTELSWWVLLDFGDVVVHILQPEARSYYELDSLYHDCPELDWRAVAVPELVELAARRIAE